MKNFYEYIIEGSKYWTLNKDERLSLSEFIETIISDKNDIWSDLSKSEQEELDEIYDVLTDTETYRKVTYHHLSSDIDLLNKIYHSAKDNDLLGSQWDLIDAFEKICY